MPSKKPRCQPRILVDIPCEVRSDKVAKGSARDLSENGVRVRLQGHVKLGDRVGISMRLPGFANMDLNFSGEVRWVMRPEMGLGCDAGIQFDHTPDSRKRVQLILWELQAGNLREVERRQRTRRIERKDMVDRKDDAFS